MKDLKIEIRQIDSLIPCARNARTHSDAQVAQIAASIKEFGWTNPVLVDGSNGIIAGHGRVLGARKLGLLEVPCIEIKNLTPTQIRAYILADNKLSENAGWDNELLSLEIKDLKGLDFDLSLIGFDAKELKDLLADKTEGLTDPDEVPEVPSEPVSKLGDVWLLGKHRLMCGDSTDPEAISALMVGNKADMVFTDPPYGVAIGDKNKFLNSFHPSGCCLRNIENDTASPEELKLILVSAFSNLRSVLSDSCAVYVTAPQGGSLGMMMMMMMMMQEAGLPTRHGLNWVKNSPTFSLGRLDYDYQHEPILFTWTKTHKRTMQGQHKTSCWFIDKPRASKLHPTMKPVELIENAILNSSDAEDIVVDIFSGSGPTIIAAEKTGRCCYTMEIDPLYVDVGVKRWQEFTGREAVRESDGVKFNELNHEENRQTA